MRLPFELVPQEERLARKRQFKLLEWCQQRRYPASSVEWLLMQKPLDHIFCRIPDSGFLIGLAVGCLCRRRTLSWSKQFFLSAYFGLVIRDSSLRSEPLTPAANAWRALRALDSPIGEAARTIESSLTPAELPPNFHAVLTELRNHKNIAEPQAAAMVELFESLALDEDKVNAKAQPRRSSVHTASMISLARDVATHLLTPFLLVNTIKTVFQDSAIFHQFPSGRFVWFRVRFNTRFFSWDVVSLSSHEGQVALRISLPTTSSNIAIVRETLSSRRIILDRSQNASHYWWRFHLWVFGHI